MTSSSKKRHTSSKFNFIFVFSIPLCYIKLYELHTVQHNTFYINIFNTYFFQATCFGYILAIIRPT
jgi:hypothetical protein